MRPKLKILFAAAEASPFTKVGGLADVAGALPKALNRLGHDVRLVTPRYSSTRVVGPVSDSTGKPLIIPVMGREETVNFQVTALNGGVPVYLLNSSRHFDRPVIYGEADDLERFTLFSRALLEVPDLLGWAPDILHCHDWHAAPAIAFFKKDCAQHPLFGSTGSVFTIHNLAYQGWFDDYFEERAGFARYTQELDATCGPHYNSMMSLAIFHSDIVSTVSENYASEILTPAYGEGLDPLLRCCKVKPFGIVNGLDYDEFDPAKDPYLTARYDASTLEHKYTNKEDLQRKLGLPVDRERPLIGMVGRLSAQKGIDTVATAMERLVEEAQIVILGKGESEYEQAIMTAVTPHPRAARALVTFDSALAQLIYAGCDIYLMPSRFEPCGLGQLIAMRYGTIPLVRHTGGLIDTVQDCTSDLSRGNGFVFKQYSGDNLIEAARRATAAFTNKKKAWRELMLRAMSTDHSWEASARKYEAMYRNALKYRASARDIMPESSPA